MDKELKKFERDLERASRLENLTMIQDWSIVGELINELTTTHINGMLTKEARDDHNVFLAHFGAIEGLRELQAKFISVQRQGKQAIDSMDRLRNG